MYDLHLHLDGSMSIDFLLKAAEKSQVLLPTKSLKELESYVQAPLHCTSLNEYLEKFELPLSVLQIEETIEDMVYECLMTLEQQGVKGAELRFAPQLHMQQQLSMEGVVEAAISGLEKAKKESSIKVGLLLCCMRQIEQPKKNEQTIQLAHKYRHKGVLGVDLAGAEALFGTELFEALFTQARRYELPFTIHAGEAADYRSIEKALSFGAHRIGHGVRCVDNPALLDYLGNRQIPLEMCPSSNVQTKAVENFEVHPILDLLRKGLLVTVNTDNMTVSNTTLSKEYKLLEQYLGLQEKEKKMLLENGKKASFLS